MRNYLWMVPVLLAAGFGYWLYDSSRAVDALRNDLENAKDQMSSASGDPTSASGKADANPHGDRSLNDRIQGGGAIDWKAVSAMMRQINAGEDQPALDQMYDRMISKLESMSQSELHDALDEIAAMGLDRARQSELEAEVVTHLMEKDPTGVLSRFDDRVGNDDDDVGWILADAVAYLAERDPAAAVRWMDEKIREGKFESKSLDGYSETRVEYESVLLSGLLGTGGGDVAARLKALPEGERLDVLEQMDLAELSPAAQSEYVKMLRTVVPEDEREGAFGYVASELVYEGGFQAVDEFIRRVGASDEERAEAAHEAALGRMLSLSEDRVIRPADVDELRDWLRNHVPSEVDRLTGEAIGEAFDDEGNVSFEQARDLAVSFHESTGNDDVLIGFLQSHAAMEKPDEAGKLLNLIQNADLRLELAKELEKE